MSSDPQFDAVWRNMQLELLGSLPEYRALIKRRVSEASKKRAAREAKIERAMEKAYQPIDRLGRDIDPCG